MADILQNGVFKETPTQVLSCEYCKIFNNNFFIEYRWLFLHGPKYKYDLGW